MKEPIKSEFEQLSIIPFNAPSLITVQPIPGGQLVLNAVGTKGINIIANHKG